MPSSADVARVPSAEVAAPLPELEADCGRCFSLCCLAPPFDAGPDFAADKAPRTPCPHLEGHRCGIHEDLPARGYRGCVAYTCHGAGQVVSERLLKGRSWKDDDTLVDVACDAFLALRILHEELAMLVASEALTLPQPVRAELDGHTVELRRLCALELEALLAVDVVAVRKSVREVLRSLRDHLPTPSAQRSSGLPIIP